MGVYLSISIDGREDFLWSPNEPLLSIEMTADDSMGFSLTLTENDAEDKNLPRAFIEDDEVILNEMLLSNDSILTVKEKKYTLASDRYFREAFGSASLKIHFGEKEFILWFEILARKIRAIHAEEMLKYLAEKSEHIIQVCLSHTTRPIGKKNTEITDPEVLLTAVENFVNSALDVRLELQHQLKKRLVPIKQPVWKTHQTESGFDPYDVLFNLDAIEPVPYQADINIKGNNFNVTGIDVSTLYATPDIEENAIILGGIYSMRRKLLELNDEIKQFCQGKRLPSYDTEYVTLGDMLLRLTVGGTLNRCNNLIVTLEELISYFERTLKVVFRGEIHPHMTPYIRGSRLYRMLFEHLKDWYALGSPSLTQRHFLTKLRSLSKIYEYFTLFKLFDYFESKQWVLNQVSFLENDDKVIPRAFEFSKDDVYIEIGYEKKIYPLGKHSEHLSLIDIKHSNASGIYWWPDFVIKVKKNEDIVYAILDAKYSSPLNIKEIHLPGLFEKYFLEMAVFNQKKNILVSDNIIGVFAIFPGWTPDQGIINWRGYRHGFLSGAVIRLPAVAAIPLSVHSDYLMVSALDRIIELSKHRLNG
jgi:hypothetical protein